MYRSLSYYCFENSYHWDSISKSGQIYYDYSHDVYSYLEYQLADYPIHFHVAVDETEVSKSLESLNFTEYFSVDGSTPGSYRPDFVTFEKTDDLSGYLISKLVCALL